MTAEQMAAADKTAPQQNKRKKVVGQSKCNYNHFPPTTQPRPNRPCPVRHSSIRTTTTQPTFVSNPRTIPTQPSHIRDSPTSTAKQRGRTAAHQSPLHAKCSLILGRVRRMRSKAPQRFEASSWASCRTTADASSFCESRAVRLRRNPSRFAPAAIHASARSATR